MKVDRYTGLQQGIPEANQFVYRDAPHLKSSQQGCSLGLVHFTTGHFVHQRAGLFTGQLFVVEDSFQYLFHIVCQSFISYQMGFF